MNYYEHHLGDYARDTTHLTALEHGVYRLLLDRYYTREEGIPEDQVYRVALARTDDERAAVDAILGEFFKLVDGLWINNKCEEEIEKARIRIDAAKKNGKRGGRPKNNPDETQQKPSGLSLGTPDETQLKAHQTPDTNHQTPERKKEGGADAQPMAFIGKVVRLSFDDFEAWKKTYHAILDIRAELEVIDAYYAEKPPKDGKWFFPASNWLKRAHNDALEKSRNADKPPPGAWVTGVPGARTF